MNKKFSDLFRIWNELYPEQPVGQLNLFTAELEEFIAGNSLPPLDQEWYKDAVVYSLYVDLFDRDFAGLIHRLDYLQDLGVNCLWLLPVLDSPMRDAGFDISDYRRIRKDLSGLGEGATDEQVEDLFLDFLDKAHSRGLKVIFDIATNHISDQHPWFREARKSKENPYRDYFIWSKDGTEFADARIIFYGIEESNWKKDGEEYYFHRFFDFQPDLNYRNPQVLLEMSRNLLFWMKRGVDGFRADAIPYIWKEEGTACENHPKTHTVVKFFRALTELVRPNTLLLAEACQKPYEVVKYFGNGDECNAGYHFPLMPQIFKSVALASREPVAQTLSIDVTPEIPSGAQWFTFLRCHDELSLELVYVTEEDRKFIHGHYCRQPEWDFRLGQGISARLAELMQRDPNRIGLIFSIMLTLPGTPVIYYGDEFGKLNDRDYYREMKETVGKDDTRFLVRGKIDWQHVESELKSGGSLESKVFHRVREMLHARNAYPVFGRGAIRWLDLKNEDGLSDDSIMAYYRSYGNREVLVVQNLSAGKKTLEWITPFRVSLLGNIPQISGGLVELQGYEYLWLLI
ncbi:MAG: alpha-amylase family glycosyl hydrolase [Bacteroidales bacterium]|jgi:maltose alpha-D-glucosyltransferase/alpha-amylase|nr:alpha-amylase family glycosyl hydrolase [Bacteroidales bacterium]